MHHAKYNQNKSNNDSVGIAAPLFTEKIHQSVSYEILKFMLRIFHKILVS